MRQLKRDAKKEDTKPDNKRMHSGVRGGGRWILGRFVQPCSPCYAFYGRNDVISKEQWLNLRKMSIETVKDGIRDLKIDELKKGIFDKESIGSEVNHIIAAEIYWLREVDIDTNFYEIKKKDKWSEQSFCKMSDEIEIQYKAILAEKRLNKDVLFGLGRVYQHTLCHYARIVRMRKIITPAWERAAPYNVGSWCRIVDYVTELLIDKKNATIMK